MKKTALFTVAALLCTGSFAQTPQPGAPESAAGAAQQRSSDPARFAQFKQEILARQQESISVLQQGIACISAAQTREQLRECRQQERQAMEQLQRRQ